jgi:rhodanese-related sulfurtransferase
MDRLLEYAGHHAFLAAAAAFMALVVVAYETRLRTQALAAASPQDVVRLMNHNALVLDIRTPELFAAGHLAGARHVTQEQLAQAADSFKKYKDKPIVLYCQSGALSAGAARSLQSQGFTQVCSLRGGVAAWRSDNLPLTRG